MRVSESGDENVLGALQGLCVSLLFCFCNTEVILALKRRFCPQQMRLKRVWNENSMTCTRNSTFSRKNTTISVRMFVIDFPSFRRGKIGFLSFATRANPASAFIFNSKPDKLKLNENSLVYITCRPFDRAAALEMQNPSVRTR